MPRNTPRAVATADVQDMADYLVSGYWRQQENRAGFHLQTGPGDVITVNLTGLNAAGKALARDALEAWEMVADIDFRETTRAGQITFTDNGALAHTGFDFGGPTGAQGATVNIGTGWLDRYGTQVGDFAFHSYIHEIGHALGLGHAGAYDGAIPVWPLGRVFADDSWNLSVMSYYGQDDNPNVDANRAAVIGPQIADILAIQEIYGAASGGVTAGNSIWGGGSNLGNHLGRFFRDYYVEGRFQPAAVTFTIVDEGGTDTLNLSHHGMDQTVNLAPGGVSNAFNLTANIMIMPGTVIENLNTGRGDDMVWGNAVANRITTSGGNDTVLAGAGDDRLDGSTGDDRLDGEAGQDSILGDFGNDSLLGGSGNDRMDGGIGDDRLDGGAGNDSLLGDLGADRLDGDDGQDRLDGGGQDDSLLGGAANDRLWGDTGDDRLQGGGGDDRLDGGAGHDRLQGDAGADVFVFTGGTDVVADFTRADMIVLDNALARDGDLTAADIASVLTSTSAGLSLDFGGRGTLTLTGFTDRAALLDRIDVL